MFRTLYYIDKLFSNFYNYMKRGGITYINFTQVNRNKILQGKHIIITGGSSGIGLEIAKTFIMAGAKVLITGRDKSKLKEVKQRIDNDSLFTMIWDVSDISSAKTNLYKAIDILGGLDVIINNAAYIRTIQYENIDEEYWDNTMNTNLKSVFFISREVCKFFIEHNGNKGGKILNISSLNSFQGGVDPYFLSKYALNSLTRGLAKKFASKNIIVNSIAPGFCNSSINEIDDNNIFVKGMHLNNRILLPKEIAELALYLCSDSSLGIIGQVIRYDAGATI